MFDRIEYQYNEKHVGHSLYRIMEVEITSCFRYNLMKMFRFTSDPLFQSQKFIFETIGINNPGHQEIFKARILTPRHKPTKAEIVVSGLFNGLSYSEIVEATGISRYYVSKVKQEQPILTPLYPYWEPDMFHRWQFVKKYLRIYEQPKERKII